eukprot:GHVT01084522.1.p1 GENE.GHVT01084522.1~~GHVT01084522.1.p1  ORF type:complete len:126 (-),score=7.45 GHVT01084522.1:23-400(-)
MALNGAKALVPSSDLDGIRRPGDGLHSLANSIQDSPCTRLQPFGFTRKPIREGLSSRGGKAGKLSFINPSDMLCPLFWGFHTPKLRAARVDRMPIEARLTLTPPDPLLLCHVGGHFETPLAFTDN